MNQAQPPRMPNAPDYRDLAALWQRHDWRESLFAPGIAILQALLPDGSTASGAGWQREAALYRCLGETAEWRALRDAGGVEQAGFNAGRDGIAAHPCPDAARRNATLEAFERLAVTGWWGGRWAARPVSAPWLEAQGIAERLDAARSGAAQKRRTGLWQIDLPSGPAVMVCRSTSFRGQQPILGYGCDLDPRQSADKALREMLLMELNLMELLAAGPAGGDDRLAPMRHRIEVHAMRCPALLPMQGALTPRAAPPDPAPGESWFGTTLDLRALSPDVSCPDGQIAVWLCRPALPAPDLSGPDGSPFL